LQSKACEKEYEQIVRTPFVVGRGFISRRFLCIYRLFSAAASHRPARLRQVLPLRVILSGWGSPKEHRSFGGSQRSPARDSTFALLGAASQFDFAALRSDG